MYFINQGCEAVEWNELAQLRQHACVSGIVTAGLRSLTSRFTEDLVKAQEHAVQRERMESVLGPPVPALMAKRTWRAQSRLGTSLCGDQVALRGFSNICMSVLSLSPCFAPRFSWRDPVSL